MKQLENFKQWQIIAFLVCLCFGLNLVSFASVSLVSRDSAYYVWAAQAMRQGDWQTAIRFSPMPFEPMCIIAMQTFVPNWIIAGQLVSLFSVTLTLIPFYLLACRLFSKSEAFISSIFLCLCPYFKEKAVMIEREPLFVLLFCTFLWILHKVLFDKNYKYYPVLMIIGIFVSLTRTEGCLVLILVPVCHIIQSAVEKKWRFFGLASICTIVVLAIFIHYSPKIPKVTGFIEDLQKPQQMAAFKASENLQKFSQQFPSERSDEGYFIKTAQNIVPIIYFIGCLIKSVDTMYFPMFLLACIGLIAQFKTFVKQHKFLVLYAIMFFALAFIFAMSKDALSKRYLLPSIIIMYFWVGVGGMYLLNKLQKLPILQYVLGIVLLVFPCFEIVKESKQNSQSQGIIAAGKWLKENYKEDLLVLTNEKRILLYGEVPVQHIFRNCHFNNSYNYEYLQKLVKMWQIELLFFKTKKSRDFKETVEKSFAGPRYIISALRFRTEMEANIIEAAKWLHQNYAHDLKIFTNERRIYTYAKIPQHAFNRTVFLTNTNKLKYIIPRTKKNNTNLLLIKYYRDEQLPEKSYIVKFTGSKYDILIFKIN